MNRHAFLLIGICCLGLISCKIGCQQSAEISKQSAGDDHDHDHDHSGRPATLRSAIEELKEIRDTISTAMEENDTNSAHKPLHEVGSLLKSIPALAADTDLPKSDWDAIQIEVDRLFIAFDEIDSAFHKKDGDKQSAYDAAKSTVDEGVAALQAYLPQLGEADSSASHEPHDHDAKDDGDEDRNHEGGHGDSSE